MLNFYYKQFFFLLATIFLFSNLTNAQDDCSSAINVPTLDGTNCPSSSPSSTNFLGGGGCEEGTLDTWFQFTAQGTSADVTISSTANGFRPEFLVVSTTNNLCTGGFLLEGCFDQGGNYTTITRTERLPFVYTTLRQSQIA